MKKSFHAPVLSYESGLSELTLVLISGTSSNGSG